MISVDDACEEEVVLPAVDRIVETNKPAHTVHTLRPIRPGALVGQTALGIDFVVGAAEPPRMRLESGPTPPAGAVLGRDVVLGTQRPVPFATRTGTDVR